VATSDASSGGVDGGEAAAAAAAAAAPIPPASVGGGGGGGGDDIFELAFHLTRPAAPGDVAASPVGGFVPEAATLHVGRLDADAIMGRMGAVATAAGLHRVAVLTCGPASLTAAVRAAAVRAGRATPGVAFDVHMEHFSW